jgi:hypothetical protein
MNFIRIPLHEDLFFERELQKFILHHIDSLYREYSEWPDRIVFKGKLGKKLFEIYNKNNWNFNPIKAIYERGSNLMIIEFTRTINVKKDSNILKSEDGSVDGKIVEGWKGESFGLAMGGYSSNMNFNMEKTEKPMIIIKLKELIV